MPRCLLAIGAGTYGAARSTYKLVDRSTHGESINPFDNKEAFFCWLNIVGTAFSFSATVATSVSFELKVSCTHST